MLDDTWIILHNANSISTVGVAAVHDDALVHVWPETNVPVRTKGDLEGIFAEAA